MNVVRIIFPPHSFLSFRFLSLGLVGDCTYWLGTTELTFIMSVKCLPIKGHAFVILALVLSPFRSPALQPTFTT